MMSISFGECAPTTNGESAAEEPGRPRGHPRWINPCGLDDGSGGTDTPDYAMTAPFVPNVKEVLDTIVAQANIALEYAVEVRDEFVSENFGHHDFEIHHKTYKDRLDWLPLPNKQLGVPTADEYLKSVELRPALVDAYEMLQYYAVALEQVVWDMGANGESLNNSFVTIERQLRAVQLEVQAAIAECGFKQKPDVQRCVMREEHRRMDQATNRRMRDWYIYRDYMILLEFLKEEFTYLREVCV